MADMEKVIKGLECCAKDDCAGDICPYGKENPKNCLERLASDAIALLKEQEDEIRKLALFCQNVDVNALLGRKVI